MATKLLGNYSFRLRVEVSPFTKLGYAELAVILPGLSGSAVRLSSRKKDTPIVDSGHLVVRADGFQTEKEAEETGRRASDMLRLALAHLRIGTDFGERAAKTIFTKAGLDWAEKHHTGTRTLSDHHGLMTFESEPSPVFVTSKLHAVRKVQPEKFETAFGKTASVAHRLTERERIAAGIYSASMFEVNQDARFLLLFVAMEVLIDQKERNDRSKEHVARIVQLTEEADLSDEDKESMLGSLRWLGSESIRQAGRRLVTERLASEAFDNRSAVEFFDHCYQLRNRLVHGGDRYPSREEVSHTAANLEVFVSRLITSPYFPKEE